MAISRGAPNAADAVRQILLTLDDPASVPTQRLLALTRARFAQMGGDPTRVRRDTVDQELRKCKDAQGTITKEAIKARRIHCGAIEPITLNGEAGATKTTLAPRTDRELMADGAALGFLQAIQALGGIKQARRMFDLLEEIKS